MPLLGAAVYAPVGADGQLRVRLALGIDVVQVFGDGLAQVDYSLDAAVAGVIGQPVAVIVVVGRA